jgi:hypothetical protein
VAPASNTRYTVNDGLGSWNPATAAFLSVAERHAEIARILAAGLMRLRAQKSSPLSPDGGESSLACLGQQSSHVDPGSLEVEHE